jgi:hypothetical protein
MTALEEIDLVMAAHHAHPSEPAVISPLSETAGMDFPGVLIVADSIDLYGRERPGAPDDAFAVFSTDNVSRTLGRVLELRRRQDRQTVAMAARVDEGEVRRSLADDLSASIHLKFEGEA